MVLTKFVSSLPYRIATICNRCAKSHSLELIVAMNYADDETCIAIASVIESSTNSQQQYVRDADPATENGEDGENEADFAIQRGIRMAQSSRCSFVGLYRPCDPCDPSTMNNHGRRHGRTEKHSNSTHGRKSRERGCQKPIGRSRSTGDLQTLSALHHVNVKKKTKQEDCDHPKEPYTFPTDTERSHLVYNCEQQHRYRKRQLPDGRNHLGLLQSRRSNKSSEIVSIRKQTLDRKMHNSEGLCTPSLARSTSIPLMLSKQHDNLSLPTPPPRRPTVHSLLSSQNKKDRMERRYRPARHRHDSLPPTQVLPLNVEKLEKRHPQTEEPASLLSTVPCPPRNSSSQSTRPENKFRRAGLQKGRSVPSLLSSQDQNGRMEGRHQPARRRQSLPGKLIGVTIDHAREILESDASPNNRSKSSVLSNLDDDGESTKIDQRERSHLHVPYPPPSFSKQRDSQQLPNQKPRRIACDSASAATGKPNSLKLQPAGTGRARKSSSYNSLQLLQSQERTPNRGERRRSRVEGRVACPSRNSDKNQPIHSESDRRRTDLPRSRSAHCRPSSEGRMQDRHQSAHCRRSTPSVGTRQQKKGAELDTNLLNDRSSNSYSSSSKLGHDSESEAQKNSSIDRSEKRLLPGRRRSQRSKGTSSRDAKERERAFPETAFEARASRRSSHSRGRVVPDPLLSLVDPVSSTEETGSRRCSRDTTYSILDELLFQPTQEGRGDAQDGEGMSPMEAMTLLLQQPNTGKS